MRLDNGLSLRQVLHWHFQTGATARRKPCRNWHSRVKQTMSYKTFFALWNTCAHPTLINYYCLGVGNSPQLSMSTKRKSRGLHAQTSARHTRTRGLLNYHTRSQVHSIYKDKQAGKRANEGKVHAGRCKVLAHQKDMQCRHPGQGTGLVAVAVSCSRDCLLKG